MAISGEQKQIVGVVTSNKMDKTITVSVEKVETPMYGKFGKKTKNLRPTTSKTFVRKVTW